MIQAMFSGISGMKAFKSNLDVIGNNIANVNTVGYKAGRATFKEMLSQTISGGSGPTGNRGGVNPSQIGLGVILGAVERNETGGSMQSTGRPTDCAIEGNGFFAVGAGDRTYYTRDGSFTTDADYNLVTSSSGMKLLGWSADPVTGNIDTTTTISPSSSIKVPVGSMALARATSTVNLSGNLNASAPVFVDSTTTPDSSYPLKFDIYDSLGVTHSVTVTLKKADTNVAPVGTAKWNYSVDCPDGGGVVGGGVLTFDAQGYSKVEDVPITLTLNPKNGAATPFTINLNMKKISQLNGTSTVDMNYQDGLPLGTLESFNVDRNGKVNGIFTNGASRMLGQVALAQFNNTSGMSKVGNNMLTESVNSGTARYGVPGEGGLGLLSSGYLESSNVDLSQEFANMIITQRGFQANSRIISTSDEILQELTNLKR